MTGDRLLPRALLVRLAYGLLLPLALMGGLAAQTPEPVTFHADAHGQISFVMPSQTIGCTYTPAGGTAIYKPLDGGPELSCDRIEPRYVRAVLTPVTVRMLDNVGDQDCCSVENVLAYGSRWSAGPFTCDSQTSGLTCRRADGRGFAISRASVALQ